jgi:hypothetical protein
LKKKEVKAHQRVAIRNSPQVCGAIHTLPFGSIQDKTDGAYVPQDVVVEE